MTSRERVLAALNHREPDRVPIDLGGSFVTGIAAQSLERLRRRLGLEDRPVKVYDVMQMLGEVELDLAERFQVDVLPVEPPSLTLGVRRGDWKPWRLFDGTNVLVPGQFNVTVSPEGDWLLRNPSRPDGPPVARMPKDGFYFDSIDYGGWNPDFRPPDLARLRANLKGWLLSDETLRYMQDHARALRRSSDKALLLGSWGATGMHYVGRLVEFWCLLAEDPAYVRDLFMLSTEAAIKNLEMMWQAIGRDVDIIAITGLDYGTQRREWFSPEVFREVYVPPLQEQFTWIHKYTPWKIFEHSCGSIPNLIGDLVDAGLDALNPVQTSAAGMDPAWLKKTFGDRLTFWGGGVETQSTLAFGTPAEVRAEVAERLRIFAPGGGFVFNPVHNIQANTPPENIIAAYETVLAAGRYPISRSQP